MHKLNEYSVNKKNIEHQHRWATTPRTQHKPSKEATNTQSTKIALENQKSIVEKQLFPRQQEGVNFYIGQLPENGSIRRLIEVHC